MPAALAVDWEQIKLAAVAGVSFPELAIQWGMVDEDGKADTNAIRQRSFREQWPIPRAIIDSAQRKLAEAKTAQAEAKESLRGEGTITVVTPDSPKDISGANLAQIAERHPLRMASFLEKKLSRAIESDTLPDIRSWKEANTADTMLRRAIGLDRPAVAVQINNWSGPTSGGWEDEVGASSVIDSETGAIEEE